MNDCFSESDLGDWTGDCLSLDEEPLPSSNPVEYDQLTGSDLILLATIPASAILLAEHLLHSRHPDMPRRIREQVLEVTKTVTLMEIINSAPDKHPRSCEVTVTNIASDTGHPVSLKIRHMHQSQNVDHTEAHTQTPEIIIKEQTWDAIQRASRRRHPNPTGTQDESGAEKRDQQRSAASRATDKRGVGRTVHSLYYRPFVGENSGPSIHYSTGTASSDTSHRTPLKERSSVLDEVDLTTMASEASSEGSVIVYADPRPRGRASSADGYFTTIPAAE
ncbi:hypothetical protein COOONC_12076 [Cooperia oncophora]